MCEKLNLICTLGYALDEDGGIREVLRSRLDRAADLFRACPRPKKIVLTGGGKKAETAGRSEAEAMREYLIERHALDDSDLVLECESIHTAANAILTRKALAGQGIEGRTIAQMTVVTQDWHIRRSGLLFAACFRDLFDRGFRLSLHGVPTDSINFLSGIAGEMKYHTQWCCKKLLNAARDHPDCFPPCSHCGKRPVTKICEHCIVEGFCTRCQIPGCRFRDKLNVDAIEWHAQI